MRPRGRTNFDANCSSTSPSAPSTLPATLPPPFKKKKKPLMWIDADTSTLLLIPKPWAFICCLHSSGKASHKMFGADCRHSLPLSPESISEAGRWCWDEVRVLCRTVMFFQTRLGQTILREAAAWGRWMSCWKRKLLLQKLRQALAVCPS